MSEPTSVEISLDAPIARVTVLEDRAMVSRVVQLPPAQGQLRLVIAHVSPLLVDKSLRASAPALASMDSMASFSGSRWPSITPATVAAETSVPRNFQVSCLRGVVPSQ